jgi:hypothetical protein
MSYFPPKLKFEIAFRPPKWSFCRYNDTQHNDIQCGATQHNNEKGATQHNDQLRYAKCRFRRVSYFLIDYPECRYAQRLRAECRGAVFV